MFYRKPSYNRNQDAGMEEEEMGKDIHAVQTIGRRIF